MEEQIKFLIEKYGNDDQRTDAWFQKRGEMLTASEIWKCFNSTPAARNEIITSKLAAPKKGGGSVGALIWGTRFESIAKEIYCKTEGITIKDLACVVHPEHSFIGASPDGLILCNNERNGRLIEIKCPISRAFDETTPVPDHYYHQMQLQIECTGLQECEYVEFQFKRCGYTEWKEEVTQFKSCFAVNNEGSVNYRSIDDVRSVEQWIVEEIGGAIMEWQVMYWALKSSRMKLIHKDLDWMPTHFPEIKSVWDEVLEHRANNTLPQVKTAILQL
jgi:putative phage-type endonuclease